MVAGASPPPPGVRLRCRPMHGARSRRVAGLVAGCIVMLSLTACHGGGSASAGSSGGGSGSSALDVKSACAALAGLEHSSDALKGVNIADPDASSAALASAIAAYSAALATFERVGPADLRASAATLRADVVAHHFGQATAARTPISAWAESHCSS
jgi:hypothetical protein